MVKKLDLYGIRFGRLTVTSEASRTSSGLTRWNCICDCGGLATCTAANLMRGNSNSCGCYRRDRQVECNTRHGMNNTRIHRIWQGMRQRCDDRNADNYKYYGGRGIGYHQTFSEFEGFLAGIPGGYHDDLTLDRIDNDGDYEPGNLRWATHREQMLNRNYGLSDILVRAIKSDLWSMLVEDVATWHNVSVRTVVRIRNQERYTEVDYD